LDQSTGSVTIEITVTNFLIEPSDTDGERLILKGGEAAHLRNVLRAQKGDSFFAIDGTGLKYRAVIESISGSTVEGLISNVTRLENEPFHNITLAMGICRPAEMDLIVEKGTEIGVSSFAFYYSEKSYARAKEDLSSARKISRLRRVARAAAKQSKRSIIPAMAPFAIYTEIMGLKDAHDQSLIATQRESSKPLESALKKSSDSKKILLLVGPPSGLSNDETRTAVDSGFVPVRLGPRRLRAETAGLVFPAMVLHSLGDL
jgi:16S rRNA (uracil1498-N3)-methyltransferase